MKTNLLLMLALAFVLTGCGANHGRDFRLVLDDCDNSLIIIDIDSLFEKADNTEESTNTPDIKPELTLTPAAL